MDETVEISGWKFFLGCAFAAGGMYLLGSTVSFPGWVVALELLLMILALFIFGSIRYRIDKNAVSYGGGLVILATFWTLWWPGSALRAEGASGLGPFVHRHFLTLHGLDALVHADTMLFILGLTLFVAVISQTRLLETVSFIVLRRFQGRLAVTVAVIAGLVAAASGVLDGVSMIGLMIRTLVILLLLSKVEDELLIYAVMVSTVVTTVCGMWLAYGEPPNLIMKANLYPLLDDAFFLRYCLPAALGSYCIVAWNLSKKIGLRRVEMDKLDIFETHAADLRFLQAMRHGEVWTPLEFVAEHRESLGALADPLLERMHQGMSLGEALVSVGVPEERKRLLLDEFLSVETEGELEEALEAVSRQRVRAQTVGLLSFIPFIGLLVWHAIDHRLPLFPAPFAGFLVALAGIWGHAKMRRLAFHEAKHEYAEYLFLFPLFLGISFLSKTGFFDQLAALLRDGVASGAAIRLALGQFAGATVLSAMLDNNVVADFAARALHGLDVRFVHLFAMAQIAGYAAGGCWTHIGSAQSVVAYAFIHREIDAGYTPIRWIKAMTPVLLEICLFIAVLVCAEGWLMGR
ncbi:MAG: SLC13 family permease [Elusimicrobiota bacterium]